MEDQSYYIKHIIRGIITEFLRCWDTLNCVWYTERNIGLNAEILHSVKTDVA